MAAVATRLKIKKCYGHFVNGAFVAPGCRMTRDAFRGLPAPYLATRDKLLGGL
jgi:hypothetical protein